MRASPPAELVELLGRLQLVSAPEVRAVHRHARRLAKDLALFDSVWVDALVQARKLTAFQAARINAGQSDSLRVGPFVLLARLPSPGYATCYRAREVAGTDDVRLTVIERHGDATEIVAALQRVIEKTAGVGTPHIIPVDGCGADDRRVWTVSRHVTGRTAAEWLVRGGRLPPDMVLEIARQMAAALTVCEARGVVHGDISATQLVLDPLGAVQLLDAGLRGAVRPREDEQQTPESLPADYDYLAPERVREAAPASAATDMYACGALWWHLLAGRPPLAGATSADRRRAAHATRIRSIYPLAPDTPRALVDAIARCTEHDIERRPERFAALLEMLGPPSDRGHAIVARHVERGASPPERLVRRVRTMRRSPHTPTWVTVAAGVLLALSIGIWPLFRGGTVDDDMKPSPPAKPIASVAPSGGAPASRQTTVASSQKLKAKPAATPPQTTQRPRSTSKMPDVVRTAAIQPVAPRAESAVVSREFVISAARPVAWEQVRPKAGQIVHARPGERAQILLPASGGTLTVDNVRFADIDFVMPRPTTAAGASLVVTAQRVSFERCSFQTLASASETTTAIHWQCQAGGGEAASGAASCALVMRECVLAQVGTGIYVEVAEPATLTLTDVLFLGSESLVRLGPLPAGQRKTDLQLKHCTVRGGRGVLEMIVSDRTAPQDERSADTIHVDARECVFAPQEAGAIIHVNGGDTPAEVLRSLAWQGEGSVVTPKIPVVEWTAANGQRRAIGDRKLPIEGVVRTELGFAGEANDGPAASRLVRWQLPLRSGQPPGIGDAPLALPPVR